MNVQTAVDESLQIARIIATVSTVSAAYTLVALQREQTNVTAVEARVTKCRYATLTKAPVCAEVGCATGTERYCQRCRNGCTVHVAYAVQGQNFTDIPVVVHEPLQTGDRISGFVQTSNLETFYAGNLDSLLRTSQFVLKQVIINAIVLLLLVTYPPSRAYLRTSPFYRFTLLMVVTAMLAKTVGNNLRPF